MIKNRGFARRPHADRRCFEQCAQLVVWFVACVSRPRLIVAAPREGVMLIDDASSNVLNWWRGSLLVRIKNRGFARRPHVNRRSFDHCAQARFISCVTLAIEHRGLARRCHADRRCVDQGAQLVTWFASCEKRGFARRLDVDRRWSGTVLRRLRGSVVMLCMYVCIYLFTYVSSYVGICLCIYVCTQARYLLESVCIQGCMHVLMHVCMYVGMYLYAQLYLGALISHLRATTQGAILA